MARKRLTVFDYQHVIEQLRGGLSARRITQLGLASRNKIAKIISEVGPLGWLDPAVPLPTGDRIRDRLVKGHILPVVPSKVEPYRERVLELVALERTPTQIFRVLKREKDFKGSVGSVKRYLKKIGATKPRAFVSLVFEPGEAAQVDFGSGPVLPHPRTGRPTKTHVFVMTLCDSRHMYAEIVWDQKVSTWLRCHWNAFRFFNGICGKIILDNLKSAILRACHCDPEVQRSYAEFARACGFKIDPCKPRTPRHKGRVERSVGYVKAAFVPDRIFRNIADANQQLLEWVLGEAGNRIHGTTQEVPLKAFAEREQRALQPLPQERPELVVWSKAKLHTNCHLNLNKAYYSAPFQYVGKELHVRATETLVELYLDCELLTLHPVATQPGQFRTKKEHYPPEKVAFLDKTPQWCLAQAEAVGPRCRDFIETLLKDRVTERIGAAKSSLRLGDKYGKDRLEAACARAISFELYRYRSLRSILDKGLDQAPEWPDDSGQLHMRFIESPRFCRDVATLLNERIA